MDVLNAPEAASIRAIRATWCDLGNQIRAKAVHREGWARGFEVFIAAGAQGAPATADMVLPESGLTPVGEVALVPDWSTLQALPYAPAHARVLADMHHQGKPWSLCPRGFVRRQQGRLHERHGLKLTAAFENEFYLHHPDGSQVDESNFASVYALNRSRPVLDELLEALVAQRMSVQQFHAEAGPGQFEISIGHAEGLAAADHQVALRETAHAVAERHGLRANFLPKPFPAQAGSGCHLHLGLEGLSADDPRFRHFMAGILQHLDALLAITAGLPISHRRLVPNSWSGAFRCWGIQNREAALRLPASPGHFEVKAVDATANPYLAIGAMVACGLDGLERRLELPPGLESDPATLPEADRPPRLPTTAGQALQELERNAVLAEALGPELRQAFLAVRRAEVARLEELGPEGEVRLLAGRF